MSDSEATLHKEQLIYKHLGTIAYTEALQLQEKLLGTLVEAKLARRRGENVAQMPHYLLFCYHLPVITLGKSAEQRHLLSNPSRLKAAGIECYASSRGGDITYHGPGQLVVYPILDLERVCKDIHRYMRQLEEVVIATLEEYGLHGHRIEGLTGVWLKSKAGTAEKIAALGVRCSHWISMHGLAFNLCTNLSHFSHIVPCGITNKGVTSLEKALKKPNLNLQAVEDKLLRHFVMQFGFVPFSELNKK